jgi:hypothetical protein
MWGKIKEPGLITGAQKMPSVAFHLAQAHQQEPTLFDSMLAPLVAESVLDNPTFSPRIPETRFESLPDRRRRNSSFVGNLTD